MAKDKALEVEQTGGLLGGLIGGLSHAFDHLLAAPRFPASLVEAAQEAEAEQTAETVEVQREGVVKMVRNASEYPEPHEADVAASEVEHYKTYGWTEA